MERRLRSISSGPLVLLAEQTGYSSARELNVYLDETEQREILIVTRVFGRVLATTAHQFMDIQERDGKECAIQQYSDLTWLLHDE